MRDFDSRIKKLYEALNGFSLVTLYYKDGTVRTVKPDEAVRRIIQDKEKHISKIRGDGELSGRFADILQAIINLDMEG